MSRGIFLWCDNREVFEKIRDSFTKLVKEEVSPDGIIDRKFKWEIDIDAAGRMDGVKICRGPLPDEYKDRGDSGNMIFVGWKDDEGDCYIATP